MSTLETNSIGKYSGNNVSVDNALNLKSYTTAQRDALTSVAGDTIFNSETGTVDFYNGSSWNATSDSTFSFNCDFLVIAGGGGSSRSTAPGGGAGGYRASWNNEASGGGGSSETTLSLSKGTNYGVVVGAGGTSVEGTATNGSDSTFATITSTGGGKRNSDGGSGGGGGYNANNPRGSGIANQGYAGGYGSYITSHDGSYNVGGGGGAGAVGSNSTTSKSGNGGAGVVSTITGASVTRGGGGGGGSDSYRNDDPGDGGSGGGGDGADENRDATAGTVNTGGGGAGGTNGGSAGTKNGSAGGSGVVIIRYTTSDATISVGAGLTSSSTTYGADTIVTFTAGNGTVSFS